MKNISNILLLLLIGVGFNTTFAQEPTLLYAGHVTWSPGADELDAIDTTGGGFSVVSTVTMTSDFGLMDGCYGLALDPISNDMYILYQSSGGASSRRLGILDVETGAISDIADIGNFVDIDFDSDGTLYGTTGSYSPDYSFLEIDPITGSPSFIFDHISSIYGSTIGYNSFTDEMIHISRLDVSTIDLGTYTETDVADAGHPGEANSIVVLTPTLAYVMHWGSMHTFNPVTGAFAFHSTQDTYHAMAFGAIPCTPMELEVTSFTVCIGGEVTLHATAESGEDVIWDGGIFDDIAFFPDVVGTFTYTATTIDEDDCELQVEIEVLDLPVVVPGAGDENYCEDETIVLSAAGDADEYSWEPLDLAPGVGTHIYTLTGSNAGGCETSATLEIIVHALPEIMPTVTPELTCIGNDVVFSVTGADEYVWEDVEIETGELYTTTEAGIITYIVTGTDINGCTNSASVDLEVADAITVTGVSFDEVEGADGSIAITITGGVPAYMVDWDNDGTGDFDDPASISGLAGGTYTIIVQGSMGCADTVTFKVDSQLAVETFEMGTINIYPNPTANAVTIELDGAFTYQITNTNGQIVYRGSGMNLEAVDLENLASGIFYFTINSEMETRTIRVVKK